MAAIIKKRKKILSFFSANMVRYKVSGFRESVVDAKSCHTASVFGKTFH
ncbi:hypothetical protein BFG60_1962 [Microcystis aeruginosa NIES-98]|nr:hypothetical protein BFG60_1962 [Microcystis aeruginosa NIES-98]